MSDPYRTAAKVETDSERLHRLVSAYQNLGMMNAVGRTPSELKRINDQMSSLRRQIDALYAKGVR